MVNQSTKVGYLVVSDMRTLLTSRAKVVCFTQSKLVLKLNLFINVSVYFDPVSVLFRLIIVLLSLLSDWCLSIQH